MGIREKQMAPNYIQITGKYALSVVKISFSALLCKSAQKADMFKNAVFPVLASGRQWKVSKK